MIAKVFSGILGKKLGLALTGLILYGFLLSHLIGNGLLLREDGGESFNAYSAYLIEHPLLIPAEMGLLVAFVLHVYLAISISRSNRKARPAGYQRSQSVGGRSWASSTMLYSGVLILLFLILHLKTFKFGDLAGGTLYDLVLRTFHNPLYAGGYVLAMILLGFHLWHALQSAFQTLGWVSRRTFKLISMVAAVLIAGGFAALPLWMYWAK